MKSLPCPPEHWPEFSRLLDEAFDLPAPDRREWLERLAGGQEVLRPWLAKVLLADAEIRTGNFLDRPRFPSIGENESAFSAGQPIGPYRLMSPLGRGGMGEVWRARRIDGALDRVVALKLPHFWIFASGMRQRLHRERDILASLVHPHIAQLHDAGVDSTGQPYLALEVIEGEPIDTYCRARGLTVDERVALFLQVLEAVRHAHSRLVVHRDIKPSNILVTAEGQVKLLDFGIAKLLGESGEGSATELTRIAGRALTPEYAAPEQVSGEPVTVATDVFSLGVVLFQLLAGKRPFGRERPPDAPIASHSIFPEHIEEVHCPDVKALRRQLTGDLDAILARCLANVPAQRYASVEQLAEDLERHMRLEPIRARRIGRGERVLRFVRRNTLAVAMSAALVVVVVSGVTGVVLQTLRAKEAAEQARDQARRADVTKNFLFDVLIANDTRLPAERRRDKVPAGELLDFGIDHVGSDYADDVDAQIQLFGLAATIYNFWGQGERRMDLLRERARLAESAHGPDDPAAIETVLEESFDDLVHGRTGEAAAKLGDADRRLREGGLDASTQRARWWEQRYLQYHQDPSTLVARTAALQNIVRINDGRAEDLMVTVGAYGNLSNLYRIAGRTADSRAAAERGLDLLQLEPRIYRRTNHSVPFHIMLALTLADEGSLDAAEAEWIAAEAPQNDRVPGYADTSLTVTAQHAWFVQRRGDRDRVARMLDGLEERAIREQVSPMTLLTVRQFVAYCLAAEGRSTAAMAIFDSIRKEFVDSNPLERAEFLGMLGDAADRSGRKDDAARAFDEALDYVRRDYAPGSRWELSIRERRDRFLLENGRIGEARADLAELAALQSPSAPAAIALAQGDLARIALADGDAAKAGELVANAIARLSGTRMIHDVRAEAILWRIRADVLDATGDAAGARDWRERAIAAARRTDDPASSTLNPAPDSNAPAAAAH